MTEDDYKELILFKLIDYDLTGIKYAALDYDGEIVISKYKLSTESSTADGLIAYYWVSRDKRYSHPTCIVTKIFMDDVPENYASMLFEL